VNTINRIVILLLTLVLLVACVALSFAPVSILQNVGGQMERWGDSLSTTPAWLRIAAGILFAFLGLCVTILIFIGELYRPRSKTIRVEKVGGGEVEVSLQTIRDRVQFDVDQLPGVLKVRPQVSTQRSGVVVEVVVESAGEAEVPDKASEIIEVVRQAVEERIGVKLARPPKVKLYAAPVPTTTQSRTSVTEEPLLESRPAPEPLGEMELEQEEGEPQREEEEA
jgi:hypothetical protein